MIEQKFGVWVLLVGGSPIERGWDRTSAGGGADKGASNELCRRVGGVDGSKEMDAN